MTRRSPGRSRLRLGASLLAGGLLVCPALALASPIAGILPVTETTLEGWSWSGRWRFPVGDALDYQTPAGAREPAFHLLRGIGDPEEGAAEKHTGADLGCGQAGAPVRAAASGIVLVTQRTEGRGGYGLYVVLGHRLPEGGLAYSVYAHLGERSIPVHVGQFVAAGERVGRVGRSGRATTPHLHFEVRLAGSPGARWEKEEVADPIAFVASRLPEPCRSDSLGDYLQWAQYAGLLDDRQDPDRPLPCSLWWRMLAVAARHPLESLPRSPRELADSLIATGILPEGSPPSPGSRVGWKDMARDLDRVRALGPRLPRRPLENDRHRAACREWTGDAHPATGLGGRRKADGPPTVATALLALADLAPELETEKPAPAKKLLAKARPAGHRARPHRPASPPDTLAAATGDAPLGGHP